MVATGTQPVQGNLRGLGLLSRDGSTHQNFSITRLFLNLVIGAGQLQGSGSIAFNVQLKAGGFLFVLWNLSWEVLKAPLAAFPPASGLGVGIWLVPGVLGALVIRKPGAAVYTEVVAAVVSALVGNQWGFATVWYGFLEGLGPEVVFAILLYRRFGLGAAIGAGAGAGVVLGLLDTFLYYPEFSPAFKTAYIVATIVSGIVIAGIGSWALTRALARTGALSSLASGRDARRV